LIPMTMNRNSIYFSIKSYIVWSVLWLFYFGISLQISLLWAVHNAMVITFFQAVMYYSNEYCLIPRFFKGYLNRQYFLLNLGFALALSAISAYINYRFITAMHVETPRGEHVYIFFTLFHFILYVITFWFSVSIFVMEKERQSRIEIEKLQREKIETELKFLKMQINPHFLFNALNNIYSLSYAGDKSVPDKISMLSDMLRYVLYDCKSDYISLEKEIEYIRNFIEFQQMKTEVKQNITFTIAQYDPYCQVAPMLLIPFIENGFKHSRIDKERDGFVDIRLSQDERALSFTVVNSIPPAHHPAKGATNSGIGIDNVKSRLELLYPGAFRLEVNPEDDTFTVHLQLRIQ